MAKIYQIFRITLDLDWHTDPVVDCELGGDNLKDLLDGAKLYAGELAAFTGAKGIKKIDLVNGHSVLGFLKIPI